MVSIKIPNRTKLTSVSGMPNCGRVPVITDARTVWTKGHVAFVPASIPGTHAWSPPV